MNILFTPGQEKVFLYMIFIGAVIGAYYDLFKAKRILVGGLNLSLFAEDLLFSIGSAVIYLFSVFVLNRGIVRWYQFFAMAVGFAVYRFTLSFLFIKLVLLLSFIISFLFSPLRYLIYKFGVVFRKLRSSLYRLGQKKKIIRYINKLRKTREVKI